MVALTFMLFSRNREAGSAMFSTLSWGVFIITMLDAIRCAADSISWERREGTLGLLFLTDLRAYDIVFGKFSTAAIKTMTTLLVTFPILAIPLMMGGVTPGEWARTIVTLMVTVLFSLSTALMFSAATVNALIAMAGSAVFLGLCMGPSIAFQILGGDEWLWLCGPLGMLLSSDAVSFSPTPGLYWSALAFSLFFSVLMLCATCWLISRKGSFDAKPKGNTWWRRLLEPKTNLAQTFSEGGFADSPALWLAVKTLPGRRILWILTAIGAVLSFFIVAFASSNAAAGAVISIQVLFCFLVKLWIGVVAPQSLHAARTSGALELLLCTPIRPANLVRGQMEALRGYIFPPALTVCVGYPLLCSLAVILTGKDFAKLDWLFVMIMAGVFWFVIFLLDYFAITYTGLWFALTSPRIEQAVGKTIGYVLLLPWLLVMVPIAGWLGMLLWPVFWICWSSYKMGHCFSARAAEQFARPSS